MKSFPNKNMWSFASEHPFIFGWVAYEVVKGTFKLLNKMISCDIPSENDKIVLKIDKKDDSNESNNGSEEPK